ncbi:hypothetical protein BP6252_11291 [Coleophoma cylindrospora]|uniref:PRISE-like Rossmann-fold domain-containing protein n=1 Tax=Coleophoma cylindrospora TaxID=1849047 RepID=A0A3D8QPI9_9HELO|nr:hypothetical protein BP6252_11291 [Coleophoma cylindrospora]
MGSEQYPLRNRGIYKNLPVFDPSVKGLTAMVTGANGISGFNTMRVLLESPERWSKVYAVSRRPPPPEMMSLLPPDQLARVEHVACDFLESSESIAKTLTSSSADLSSVSHIFFYSYLQPQPDPGAPAWSNAEQLVNVNVNLLTAFLGALPLANIHPKRVLLQTGAKNYGVHIGRTRTPCVESDPQPRDLQPNFYYGQEEALWKYCRENNAGWNVIRPAWIIGAVCNAQMNALLPSAFYASVQAQKKEPLRFPSDWESWQCENHYSTAKMTGYLSEWVVLEDKCKNQAFNAQDDSPLSWDRLYEELARWFGVEKGVVGPEEDETKFKELAGRNGIDTPMGYGPPTKSRMTFIFVDWAKEPDNIQAWKTVMSQSKQQLTFDPFEDAESNFTFGDAAFMKMSTLCLNKARRLGWCGFVDTMESIFEAYQEMGILGIVPAMQTAHARPLI